MSAFEEAMGAPLKEFLKIWDVPRRLRYLAFSRRMVEDQIDHNLRVSKVEMKKQLGWLSLACMGIGTIIATGIFSFMPFVYASITGPSVILSIIIASIAAAISAYIYSEFAVEYPVVGGGYVYVLNTFGELPAILCAMNLVIDYLFGTAAVARNFSVYIAQLFNKDSSIFQKNVGFQTDDVDYLALILILALTVVVCWSTKFFDEGNIYLQGPHILLVILTFVIAFTKSDTGNWDPFYPKACSGEGTLTCPADGSIPPKSDACVDASWGPAGARRIVTGASNLFFIFIGYDVIALGSEEAKSIHSVPLGMLGVVIFVTVVYILMASSLIMLFPFAGIACQPETIQVAAFAYAFERRGLKWAKYIVAGGASIGVFTSTGITLFGLSRIFQVFAREGVVPPIFGRVNSYTNTPLLAVVLSGIVSALMSFFTSFSTLANMTSIGTLVMFWFVAISHLYRRYAPDFERESVHENRHLSIPFRPDAFGFLNIKVRRAILLVYITLITAFPVGFTIYWNLSDGSSVLIVMAVCWFVTTLLLQLTMPIYYVPKTMSIPWYLMPWAPSISVWANVMLIGGFGANKADYIRLFTAMGIALVIYLLYGVHANYYRFFGDDDEVQEDEDKEDGE